MRGRWKDVRGRGGKVRWGIRSEGEEGKEKWEGEEGKWEGGEEENKNRNAKRKRTNKIRNYFNINIQIFFSSPHKTKHVIKWPPQNTSHHPLVLHLTGHQFGKHRSFLFVFWFVTTMTASYVKSYCDQFTDHTNKKVDSRTVWWFTAARFVDRMKREKLQVFFFFFFVTFLINGVNQVRMHSDLIRCVNV